MGSGGDINKNTACEHWLNKMWEITYLTCPWVGLAGVAKVGPAGHGAALPAASGRWPHIRADTGRGEWAQAGTAHVRS